MLGGNVNSAASAAATPTAPSGTTVAVEATGGSGVLGTTSLSSEEDNKSAARAVEGDRLMGYNSGNRWPRQETLALLKIRSDMDAAFRDSSHKSALWEEVSRKLGDLGYHRTPKKCKEKFENVYKYHKRTKDGRTGKSEGKNYRFFQQLEAFESVQSPASHSPIPSPTPLSSRPPLPPQQLLSDHMAATTTTVTLQWSNNPPNVSHVTVPSTTNPTPLPSQNMVPTNIISNVPALAPLSIPTQNMYPYSSFQSVPSALFSSSTSSSTASDEGLGGGGGSKRKRKWKGFFERLAKDVLKKQEELQRRLLEALERHDRERTVREEAWRTQEKARIDKEHEVLIQERSAAAAKDAAIITFLQKMSGREAIGQTNNSSPIPPSQELAAPPLPQLQPQPPPPPWQLQPQAVNATSMELDVPRRDNGDSVVGVGVSDTMLGGASSSRWPKAEVHALITIRTNLDVKYNQSGPKGPLWEEISAAMSRIGYNRSSKRCKEKWENINKYFKKVKESSKKRPEDSKTCPYFHLLDALYKEKSSKSVDDHQENLMEPLAVRPKQQWPPPGPVQEHQPQIVGVRENMEEDDDEELEEGDSEDEDDEDDEEGGFVVVPNKSGTGNGEGDKSREASGL